MIGKVPHNALVVVADAVGAKFFRNDGRDSKISLSADGHLEPANLLDDVLRKSVRRSYQSRKPTRQHLQSNSPTNSIAVRTTATSQLWC